MASAFAIPGIGLMAAMIQVDSDSFYNDLHQFTNLPIQRRTCSWRAANAPSGSLSLLQSQCPQPETFQCHSVLAQASGVSADAVPSTLLAPSDAAVLAGLAALNVTVAQLFGGSPLLDDLVRCALFRVESSSIDERPNTWLTNLQDCARRTHQRPVVMTLFQHRSRTERSARKLDITAAKSLQDPSCMMRCLPNAAVLRCRLHIIDAPYDVTLLAQPQTMPLLTMLPNATLSAEWGVRCLSGTALSFVTVIHQACLHSGAEFTSCCAQMLFQESVRSKRCVDTKSGCCACPA